MKQFDKKNRTEIQKQKILTKFFCVQLAFFYTGYFICKQNEILIGKLHKVIYILANIQHFFFCKYDESKYVNTFKTF